MPDLDEKMKAVMSKIETKYKIHIYAHYRVNLDQYVIRMGKDGYKINGCITDEEMNISLRYLDYFENFLEEMADKLVNHS